MYHIARLDSAGNIPAPYDLMAGQRLKEMVRKGTLPEFESLRNECLFTFCLSHKEDAACVKDRIVVSVSKDRILFLCSGKETAQQVEKRMADLRQLEERDEKGQSAFRDLYLLFHEILREEAEKVEALEDRVTETENHLILNQETKAADKIMGYRKEIRNLKKINEPLDRILQGLYENDYELIGEDLLRHYKALNDRMDRLLNEIQNLHEYVSQLREAYQAQIDIQQNNLMKVFTMVSTIFLPLTLLVGWYGMNLRMPEYGWKYGYPLVALMTLLILAGGFLFFKKKKWL